MQTQAEARDLRFRHKDYWSTSAVVHSLAPVIHWKLSETENEAEIEIL